MGRRADPENRAGKGSEQAELPQGVLTFLLTDIEASTPLWERHGASMGTALALHQALIARTVAAHDGRLIKRQGEGDSTLSVFVRASDAVAAALRLQQALYWERRPGVIALRRGPPAHRGGGAARRRLLRAGAQPGRQAALPGSGRPDPAVQSDGRAGGRPAPRRGRPGRRRIAPAEGALTTRERVCGRPPRPGRFPAGPDCCRAAWTRRNTWPPTRSPWDGGRTTRWSPSTTRSCSSGSDGSRAGCPSWRRPSGGSSTGSRPTPAGGRRSPCCSRDRPPERGARAGRAGGGRRLRRPTPEPSVPLPPRRPGDRLFRPR
jgi:hypothetical protein